MSDEITIVRGRQPRRMDWHAIAHGTEAMNTDAGCLVAKTVTSGVYTPAGVSITMIPDAWLVHRWEVERDGDRITAYRRFQISAASAWPPNDPFAWRDADDELPRPSDEQILARAQAGGGEPKLEVKS